MSHMSGWASHNQGPWRKKSCATWGIKMGEGTPTKYARARLFRTFKVKAGTLNWDQKPTHSQNSCWRIDIMFSKLHAPVNTLAATSSANSIFQTALKGSPTYYYSFMSLGVHMFTFSHCFYCVEIIVNCFGHFQRNWGGVYVCVCNKYPPA